MPQFEPSAFASQLVWLAIIFAFLYFAVVRPTLPKVGRVIDEREGKVSADLDAATSAKGEADSIRSRYDEAMVEARRKAQAAVATAQDHAAGAAEKRMAALALELDARTDAAAARLSTARLAAEALLADAAAALTSDAVARIAGIEITPAEARAALAEGGAGHG